MSFYTNFNLGSRHVFHLLTASPSVFPATRFFATLLFTIVIGFSYAQPCADTAKKINYYSPGYRFVLQQHIVSANDSIQLSGRYINAGQAGIFYTQIQPDGTVGTSRLISSDSISSADNANALLHSDNGNTLISVGAAAGLNGGSGDSSFKLLMLAPNGSIIWSKKYRDANNSLMAVKTIKETSDHDFIVMVNFIDLSPLHETDFGTALYRIDASGNVMWSRYISVVPNYILEGTAFTILNDRIYCVGVKQNQGNFYLGFPDYEHNLWAAKIDATDGQLIDSKSYLDLRIQTNPNSFTAVSYIYANLLYTGNGAFIFTDRHEKFDHSQHGVKKAVMDTNLLFSNATFFKYNGPNTERILANEKKEIILYNHKLAGSGSNVSLEKTYVSKFDSAGNPIREMQLSYPPGSQFQSVGWKPIGLKRKYISLINSFLVSGDTHFQLWQMPDDIAISPCYGTDTSFIQKIPYPITEVDHPFLIETRNISLQPANIIVTSSELPFISTTECVVQSTCSDLFITGPDTICNLANTYSFTAHKNNGCSKHVRWQIDTSAVSYTEQINDTTIIVKFKKSWQGYLYASINSCDTIKDSIQVNVFKTPADVSFGGDRVICKGDSILLNAGAGFENYIWQNGSADSTFWATQSGVYFVEASDYCGNYYSDTINVLVNEPQPINLGNDTGICRNSTLVLDAGNGFSEYLWSNGNATQYQEVVDTGNYSVAVKNNYGCISSDSMRVTGIYPLPSVSLNKNAVVCLNQNNRLDAGGGFSSYLWQNGTTASIITVTTAGVYKVTVSNSFQCFSSDSVKIDLVAFPPSNFLAKDSGLCSGETILIKPLQIFDRYLWSTGSTNADIVATAPSVLWLTVTDKNKCTGTDSIKIFTKDCYIYIPNAFSPNNDGKNDLFKPLVSGRLLSYRFNIYNRYGQLIFSTTEPGKGWDGSISGLGQNSGSFVWTCSYQFINQPAIFKKGTVTLIR